MKRFLRISRENSHFRNRYWNSGLFSEAFRRKFKENQKSPTRLTGPTGNNNLNSEGLSYINSNRFGDPALEEEQKLRKKVTKGAWSIGQLHSTIIIKLVFE